MTPSKFDVLHDRYHAILSTKKGTRYEILAAVVFAALERDAVVIHDLNLIGDDSGRGTSNRCAYQQERGEVPGPR